MSYNTPVYTKQGGAEMVVGSGGSIDVESGGALKFAGTDRTSGVEAAAQNTGTLKAGAETAVASEASAGSVSIATGLSSIASFGVTVLRSNAVATANAVLTVTGGALTVANGATGGLVLATGDVINWHAVGAV